MILGFAHITRNVADPILGIDIPSAPEKWRLMQRKAKRHRLAFHAGSGVHEETVAYDTGTVKGSGCRLYATGGKILIDARNPWVETGWFATGLGFKVGASGLLHLLRPVPHWCVKLDVRADADAAIDPPLDIAGYTAIAFYSSDVEADRDKLIAAGGRTPTDPFKVTIDREMKIVMLRSPEGTIIELIEVRP